MFDYSRTVFFFAVLAIVSWPIQLWVIAKAYKKAKNISAIEHRNTKAFYSKAIVLIVAIIFFVSIATLNGNLGSSDELTGLIVNCALVIWPSLIALLAIRIYELVKNHASKTA
jgi:hypothetical protein